MTKNAVVTGAGSGVGRSVALAMLGDGWRVALVGRRRDALEETASQGGQGALVTPADISDPEAVTALFAEVGEAFGRLDFLFNNAGTNVHGKTFDQLSAADWQGVVSVNLSGAFYCAQAAYRMMMAQSPKGGRIVNNGSVSAHVPRPHSAPYTATKHAITGLTRSIALDGRAHDIACGQVDIGNAATPMTRRMSTGVPQPDGTSRVEPTMDVDAVARSVLLMANLPLDANIPFLTVMATKMPYLGRG